jgi:hypothetical protein
MLTPSRAADAALTDADLFALPAMVPVRKALDAEFDRYVEKHEATLPNESIGVGSSFAFQLFDRSVLESQDARFVLAGVVNRMDRAYADPAHCGEIRLIYRLARSRRRGRLSAAADDAQPGAEGAQRRGGGRQHAKLRRDRAALA